MPNRLIHSSSPYLLQHAHNPVDWYPWGKEALERAQSEKKPILVSIGYAACHWCHVMERESFEDKRIAALMNDYFVCIKVDREERPDVDTVYMDAVQALGVQGGWPLNVFLLPDQRPFFGGTYFKPQQWADLLERIGVAFEKEAFRSQLEESAERLTAFLQVSESERYTLDEQAVSFSGSTLRTLYQNLSEQFDNQAGGFGRAPKFPMPVLALFLLRYQALTQDQSAAEQAALTLKRMARGGIYDQIGGGFARYSVTGDWLVPHFEKMLYDNAQLLSVYAEAFQLTADQEYADIIREIIGFMERELSNGEGGYFSALDADSEGEEGKFYIWSYTELQEILPEEDLSLCADYFDVRKAGSNWPESGQNILQRRYDDQTFAEKHTLSREALREKVASWKSALMNARSKRTRPERDEKTLTSWNGLALKGLVDAFNALGDPQILVRAQALAQFLERRMKNGEQLWHNYKDGNASIQAYLEDYACLTQGLIALYQVSLEEKWLHWADELTRYALRYFQDEKEALLFFTDTQSEPLVARKKEVFDNVIPASNSIMAHNLFWLSYLLDKETYREQAMRMLGQMQERAVQEPRFLANWASLYLLLARPVAEVAFVGKEANAKAQEFLKTFYPYKVVLGTTDKSDLPLLKNRKAAEDGQTLIYVCRNRTCRLPVGSLEAAWQEVKML